MSADPIADRIYAGIQQLHELDQIAALHQAIEDAEWVAQAIDIANSGRDQVTP